MRKFRIYNTASRKKEDFEPLSPGRVGMYVCGITPYGESHLGHARCYVVFDTLRRYLESLGYAVTYVQNITDIDDKIIDKSRAEETAPDEIARKYFDSFAESMKKLNVRPADHYPRVTGNIGSILEFISGLISRGSAYENEGSVYFRVSSLEDYGLLSGRTEESRIASRVSEQVEKEDPRDFAVWKKDAEHGWPSPWGKGRPGWHIECSAMSRKILGDRFDIHGGGLDLIFPHHENEIAQSKALTGKDPARFWVHNGMVTLRGDKMAKSTGNFFLLSELLKEVPGEVVRMYILGSGYRQTMDFDPGRITETGKAWGRLAELRKELRRISDEPYTGKLYENDAVSAALDDDLNTAKALGEIFKAANPVLEKIFNGKASGEDIGLAERLVAITERVLGINLESSAGPDEAWIEEVISRREELRKEGRFGEADIIRDELAVKGVEIKDTPTGTHWVRKK